MASKCVSRLGTPKWLDSWLAVGNTVGSRLEKLEAVFQHLSPLELLHRLLFPCSLAVAPFCRDFSTKLCKLSLCPFLYHFSAFFSLAVWARFALSFPLWPKTYLPPRRDSGGSALFTLALLAPAAPLLHPPTRVPTTGAMATSARVAKGSFSNGRAPFSLFCLSSSALFLICHDALPASPFLPRQRADLFSLGCWSSEHHC